MISLLFLCIKAKLNQKIKKTCPPFLILTGEKPVCVRNTVLKCSMKKKFSPELKCFNSHEHRLASIHVPGGKYCISYCHSLKFWLFWCEEVRTVYSRASRAIKFIKHNVCHVHHLRLTQTLTH